MSNTFLRSRLGCVPLRRLADFGMIPDFKRFLVVGFLGIFLCFEHFLEFLEFGSPSMVFLSIL